MNNKSIAKGESRITKHAYVRYSILVPAFTFALCLGYLHGRLLSAHVGSMQLQPDTRPAVATVELTGIRNGKLIGNIIGDGRLILGSSPVVGSGTFAIPAGVLLTNVMEVDIPSWARFVASRRGKKYYPLHASEVRNLTPSNRLYFSTSAEAESAGFIP